MEPLQKNPSPVPILLLTSLYQQASQAPRCRRMKIKILTYDHFIHFFIYIYADKFEYENNDINFVSIELYINIKAYPNKTSQEILK